MQSNHFITLDSVTVRLGNAWLLNGLNWKIHAGENWVIWGANGAGKTTLAKALLGQAQVVRGSIQHHYRSTVALEDPPPEIALVSSDQQMDLYRREQMLGHMRHFSGRLDEETRAGEVVTGSPTQHNDAVHVLRVAPLLNKPLHALSAGEMRRLLIGRALMKNPRLLILDEPFNGLDADTRDHLLRMLNQLAAAGTQMVLITHRTADIADAFTHLLHLDNGQARWHGPVDQFSPEPDASAERTRGQAKISPLPAAPPGAPLIEMHGVNVAYGETTVLSNLHWTMRKGENWAIVGPNGAGKSTLLKLITGDNLQGYANDLMLFGRPKGSGESVWEVKQQIGYVADDLQLRYQKKMSGFDVVCSGFFDSVGLYRRCSDQQRATAQRWLEDTGVAQLAKPLFSKLSFGQQRMLLIVRAMVKTPRLLILDEPCNGLDRTHRHRLLQMLDVIGNSGTTNLLYVSHRPDEMPHCITHSLHLSEGELIKEARIDLKKNGYGAIRKK